MFTHFTEKNWRFWPASGASWTWILANNLPQKSKYYRCVTTTPDMHHFLSVFMHYVWWKGLCHAAALVLWHTRSFAFLVKLDKSKYTICELLQVHFFISSKQTHTLTATVSAETEKPGCDYWKEWDFPSMSHNEKEIFILGENKLLKSCSLNLINKCKPS